MFKNKDKKNNILLYGVLVFSFFIFILWFVNIRLLLIDNFKSGNEDEVAYWQNIQDDFNESFIEMNQIWQETQTNQAVKEGEKIISNLKERILVAYEVDENKNENIQEEIEELIDKKNEIDCPEFINCLGLQEEECLVPEFCEGTTLLVY